MRLLVYALLLGGVLYPIARTLLLQPREPARLVARAVLLALLPASVGALFQFVPALANNDPTQGQAVRVLGFALLGLAFCWPWAVYLAVRRRGP